MTLEASGPQCAHENGIVHRYVRLANVMVRSDDVAKVMDFGISRLAHGSSAGLTAGILFGAANAREPNGYYLKAPFGSIIGGT
jgi:serine/threonine protein kinase